MKNDGICIVAHTNDLSGANRALIELVEGLNKLHGNIHVALPRKGKVVEELEKNNISYNILGYTSWIDHKGHIYKKIIKMIINFIKQVQFLWFCKKNNIGLVHYNSSAVGIGANLFKLFNIRYIYHIREFIDNKNIKYHSFKSAKKIFNNAHTLIAISESVKEKCKQIGIDGNWIIISDGVSVKQKNIYKEADYRNGIIVGAVENNKGQFEAVKAVNELNKKGIEFTLYVVGPILDTKYHSQIMIYVQQNNLQKNIIWVGETDDVDLIRKKCGIALVCSKYEAFGRVTAEAMTIGEIVIGANVGATAEIISDGYNGILYDIDSTYDLCEKIKRIIIDKDKYYKIIDNAKNTVDTKYTKEQCITKVSQLYKQIE